MMTLKDIKISRSHIPVQNALWLRPTGGFTFKVYYPHGGEWAEAAVNGTDATSEEEIKELDERLTVVENTIKDWQIGPESDKIQQLLKDVSSLKIRVGKVEENQASSVETTMITNSLAGNLIEEEGTLVLFKNIISGRNIKGKDLYKNGLPGLLVDALFGGVYSKVHLTSIFAGYYNVYSRTSTTVKFRNRNDIMEHTTFIYTIKRTAISEQLAGVEPYMNYTYTITFEQQTNPPAPFEPTEPGSEPGTGQLPGENETQDPSTQQLP